MQSDHAIFGFDAATEAGFLYVDTVLQEQETWPGGTNAEANPLVIGNRGEGVLDFDGRVQALGIWIRVLTADERTFLYNGGNAARLYADLS